MDIIKTDIALIGAGIMSATLATLLNELLPDHRIYIIERLPEPALESSDAWNNAGTGHSAFCELNYTPFKNGQIDISKAIHICSQFELSREFWSFLVKRYQFDNHFIHQVSHHSFVTGDQDVHYLKARHEALSSNHLFAGMEYSEHRDELKAWFPLIMNHRTDQSYAATRMKIGTDIDFGKLTRQLIHHLDQSERTTILYNHDVKDIDRNEPDERWELEVKSLPNDNKFKIAARFVFVGAGGGALRLLNRARIDEIDGFGGFPVGGKWLQCTHPEVIALHHAKVYGQAKLGAPPMSVPHLDTRYIEGKRELLFGPYAGFSTKFLKQGSYWDLPGSIDWDNLWPMIQAGLHNLPLTQYLIEQVNMGFDEKFEALLEYYPSAQKSDWSLVNAGQRVQVIKKDADGKGIIEFGTELVHTQDGTLAGLLGASPGASTAVSIMLDLLIKCFTQMLHTQNWKQKLEIIIPGFYHDLKNDQDYVMNSRKMTSDILFTK